MRPSVSLDLSSIRAKQNLKKLKRIVRMITDMNRMKKR